MKDPRSSSHSGNSRRDFIKLAAASLGGTLLAGVGAGCGGGGLRLGGGGGGFGGSVGVGVIPNGYTFYRLFTPHADTFLQDVTQLQGGVMNNDDTIQFYAESSSGAIGVYRLAVEYNGPDQPNVPRDGAAVIVRQGDLLGGEITVDKIGSAALSNGGIYSTCAAVLKPSSVSSLDKSLVGVPSLWQNGDGDFSPLVTHYAKAPGGGFFGASMGDVAINGDGSILLSADFSYDAGSEFKPRNAIAQGLFQLDGSASDSGTLLAKTGDQIQGSNDTVVQFGLCDFDNRGNYVVQHFSRNSEANGGGVSAGILGGAVRQAPFLLTGGRRRGGMAGNTFLGPRITDGNHTEVVHTDPSNSQHVLLYNQTEVARTGGSSPSGRTILGIGPGSVSNDLTHYLATVDDGMELIVSNGQDHKTILKYGDKLANSPTEIRGIIHGFHSDQADTQGRIVLVGEFADGSQSIVVGIPN